MRLFEIISKMLKEDQSQDFKKSNILILIITLFESDSNSDINFALVDDSVVLSIIL